MMLKYFITSYILHILIFWGYSIYWSRNNVKKIFNIRGLEIISYVLKTQFILLPLLGIPVYLLYYKYGNTNSIEYSFYELYDFLCLILFIDITFYGIHRLLHTKLFFRYHKIHHSSIFPYPWSALYASIFENIFLNLLPPLLLPLLLQIKMPYFVLFISIATFNSIYTHSRNNIDHAKHHLYYNVNYGVTKYSDILFGTYKI